MKMQGKRLYEPLWRIVFWKYMGFGGIAFGFFRTEKKVIEENEKYRYFYKLRKAYKLKKKGYSVSDISNKLKLSGPDTLKILKQGEKYSDRQIKTMPLMGPETATVFYGIMSIVLFIALVYILDIFV